MKIFPLFFFPSAPVEGGGDGGPALLSIGQECEDWPVQRVMVDHFYLYDQYFG